jgi:hypothetical protein
MRVVDLPADARDSKWFWVFMKPGESAYDLALRCPAVPEDLDVDEVFRWTSINAGVHRMVLLAARYEGKPHIYSFQEA